MTTETVDFWFDPLCPWAWMTSRWVLQAQQVRDLRIDWHFMSLAYLNTDKDISPEYRELVDKGWGPLRVIAAARAEHGQKMVLALYTAMGTHHHVRGVEDFDETIELALSDVGLPASLAEASTSTAFDDEIRAETDRAISLVGDDVGTPVIAVDGAAFFGPVVTPAPKGEDAGRLWDGVLLVARTQGFYELKRSRTDPPIFD